MKYLKLFDSFYFDMGSLNDIEDLIKDRLAELDDSGYHVDVLDEHFGEFIVPRRGSSPPKVIEPYNKIYITINKSTMSSNDIPTRFKMPFSGNDIKDNLESLVSVLKEKNIILDEFYIRKEGDPVLKEDMYRYFINREKMETLLPKVLNGLSLMNLKLSFRYETYKK